MRLRKRMSRIALTLSCSRTYSRIDSSGSIEIAQRFSSISTSWKPTSARLKTRDACSWADTSQTIVRLPSAAARRPSAIATVVLPTPPLPVTTTRRFSSRSADTEPFNQGPCGRPPAQAGACRLGSKNHARQENRMPMRITRAMGFLSRKTKDEDMPREADQAQPTEAVADPAPAHPPPTPPEPEGGEIHVSHGDSNNGA